MHHIYHTEGVILSSRNYGEADKYYRIFTKDLGVVYASASGVRKMSSKLRFVLQDFSYVKVDLVRGKDFWRVTSASKSNLLEELRSNKDVFGVFSNVIRLLKKLLPGEDPNELLFDDLIKGLLILEKSKTKEELANTEVVLVLRVLSRLGYIGGDHLVELIESPFEEDLVFEVVKNKPEILKQINQALRETHL